MNKRNNTAQFDEINKKNENEPPVYNYVSSVEKPLTWNDFKHYIEFHGASVPTIRCMWYYCLIVTRTKLAHYVCLYLLHYLPALLIDGVIKLMRKEGVNLFQIYKKIDKFSSVLSYFSTQSWKFSNQRVQSLWDRLSPEDKQVFQFNMKELDWDRFFYNYIRGIRVYLVKDDLSTLPQAMIRWKRFYWAHQFLKLIFFYIAFRILWATISASYSYLV
uniref:Fatty acyl-CoA reductase C-terminal domain-containing protein n=2 Tax=Clastoptera arizonana TaxID=38151 RepID=A0A1B6D3B3_9HEMI